MRLVYIEDLGHDNYKEYVEVIRESIREIIRFEELSLYSLSGFVGISRQSLYRHFKFNKNIGFASLVKMNNFLKRYKDKIES